MHAFCVFMFFMLLKKCPKIKNKCHLMSCYKETFFSHQLYLFISAVKLKVIQVVFFVPSVCDDNKTAAVTRETN